MTPGNLSQPSPHPVALQYHPNAYQLPSQHVMGRHMAGYTFLKAFLPRRQQLSSAPLPISVDNRQQAEDFLQSAAAIGCRPEADVILRGQRSRLAQVGALHLAGPALGEEAWRRSFHGSTSWSLTGLTHTTASDRVMEAIAAFLTAPVQPWDALICTSTAVKNHVERQLEAMADHLSRRLGAQRFVRPQLPVIPLGVIGDDEAFSGREGLRAQVRRDLELEPEAVVVLFVGRLSFHAKAHPVPMYLALEQAQARLKGEGRQLVLVEFGVHGLETVERAYAEAAHRCCPSVRCIHLDGQQEPLRRRAFAVADLFCSLSDNIQEAFGITPLEAMAAGLPVIVSDWDGYRDTVRHGIDGYRVASLAPRPGLGNDLAYRHGMETLSYDRYVGYAASVTAVDVKAVEAALVALALDPERRRRMGEAGRQRIRHTYDWTLVLGRYEELWAELKELREAAGAEPAAARGEGGSHPWPTRLDPFTGFQGHPSGWLEESTRLRLPGEAAERLQSGRALRRLAMVGFAESVLPTEGELEQVLEFLARGNVSAEEVLAAVTGNPLRRGPLLRGLGWMLKVGLIEPESWPQVPPSPFP